MKCGGYKYSQYDATYRKAMFSVNERGNRVLEVTDVDSGTTFLLDLNDAERGENSIKSWRKDDTKGHGKSIHFGKAGFFEQLNHSGRSKNNNI